MKILALDLGKFNTMCCYFDTKTRKHEQENVGPKEISKNSGARHSQTSDFKVDIYEMRSLKSKRRFYQNVSNKRRSFYFVGARGYVV